LQLFDAFLLGLHLDRQRLHLCHELLHLTEEQPDELVFLLMAELAEIGQGVHGGLYPMGGLSSYQNNTVILD